MKRSLFFLFFFSLILVQSLSFVSAEPIWLQNPPDRQLEFNDYFSMFVSSYVTGISHDSTTLSFRNPDTNNNVILFGDTGGSHTNSYFSVSLSTQGFIQFSSKNRTYNSLAVTLGVGNNHQTQSGRTFYVDIEEDPVPVQIASFASPYNLASFGSVSLSLNNFFDDYNTINVSYYDDVLASTVTLVRSFGQLTSVSNGSVYVSLSPYTADIYLTIVANNLNYNRNFTITAYNAFGSVKSNFTVITTAGTTHGVDVNPALPLLADLVTMPSSGIVYNIIKPNSDLILTRIDLDQQYPPYPTLLTLYSLGSDINNIDKQYAGYNETFTSASKNVSWLLDSDTWYAIRIGSLGTSYNLTQYMGSYPSYYEGGGFRWYSATDSVISSANIESNRGFFTMFHALYYNATNITLPVLTTSLDDVSMIFDDTYPDDALFFDDYFSNYDTIEIEYNNQSVSVTKGTIGDEQLSNQYFDLFLYEGSLNVIQMNINSKDVVFSGQITVTASNGVGSVEDTFVLSINERIEDDGVLASFVNNLLDALPSADDLSLRQRFAYVVIIMVLSTLILFLAAGASRLMAYIAFTLLVLEFIFFIAVGYIPLVTLLVGLIIFLGVIYIRSRG